MGTKEKKWTRDPTRRDKILRSATILFRERGFAAVGVDDIGGLAGITGPGVYRHFASKDEILVALAERVTFGLADGGALIAARGLPPRAALEELIAFHLEVVLQDRAIAAVYLHEESSLPREVRHSLRVNGRRYVEIWVGYLTQCRPELGAIGARVMVQGVIGLLHSVIYQGEVAAQPEVAQLLTAAACSALFDSAVIGPGDESRSEVEP